MLPFTTQLLILLVLGHVRSCLSFTITMPDSDVSLSEMIHPRTGARTDTTEQKAVYDIMRATGNDWVTSIPDVCHGRWHGIECVLQSDNMLHVVSLSFGVLSDDTAFPMCSLTRPIISPSITKLTHLRTLFFYNCLGSNPQVIPRFLGLLGSSLQTLVLRGNGLIGPIPSELGNLLGLRLLDLHGNNLNGAIPATLGRINRLTTLDLSRNRLSGEVPSISYPKLAVLDLNQNQFTGQLPLRLLSSTSLIKIDLSRNRFSGEIPQFTGLTNLILLDLSYNALTGPLLESFESLKSLQALVLRDNPSAATTLRESTFAGLINLVVLDLSNMNLEGPIPESIGDLKTLRVVRLDGNRLNGSIPASFAGSNGLSELRLEGNELTGAIPLGREKIWRMGRNLRIGNNLGLCYDTGIGDDDLSSLSGNGIGRCAAAGNRPKSLEVDHVSGELGSETRTESGASESGMGIGTNTIFFMVLLWLL